MPENPNHDRHESMDAVVGAPEMKVEPIAFKIEIKPADAGVKEKTMDTSEEIVVGKIHQLKTEGSRVSILLDSDRWLGVSREEWSTLLKECGDLGYGFDEEVVFHVSRCSDVVGWHPKDPMLGLVYARDYSGYDSHGIFEKVLLDPGDQAEVHFRLDSGEPDMFWVSNFEQAERRFGKLVPGTRYEWLLVESCGSDIVGWREAPLPEAEADTVSKTKDPMEGIDYIKEGGAAERFGIVHSVVEGGVLLSANTFPSKSWTCYHYEDVAERCGEMVPGKSYHFFFGTMDWDLVGWKEAPIPDGLTVFSYGHGATPEKEPATEQPAAKEQEPVGVPEYGIGRVGVFARWAEDRFIFDDDDGDPDFWFLSGPKKDAAIARCGDMVPGKRYRWLWGERGAVVGWREEPKPEPHAPAAPPADPPMSAMRFMAKRLGVRLPDDVAGVGHATNVIEDALGAKMQQAMADTAFGVIHDILRDLGISLEDNKGEPLGSYRHRVQAAIHGKIGLARFEGHDDGVNEVLKSLEDQIEDGERQRKMLAEQLERVNAHRITLQQVHADARKMRRGGAS